MEEFPQRLRPLLLVPLISLIFLMIWPVWQFEQKILHSSYKATGMLDYAKAVRENTELNAVVISPGGSLVPVYYSRRHIIRGIANEESVRLVMGQVGTEFPGLPVYLAIPPASSGSFTHFISTHRVVVWDKKLLLISLGRAGEVGAWP